MRSFFAAFLFIHLFSGAGGIILPLDSLAAGPSVQCQQSTSSSARFLSSRQPICLYESPSCLPVPAPFLYLSLSYLSKFFSYKQVAHLLTLICMATAKYDLFCLRLNKRKVQYKEANKFVKNTYSTMWVF